MMPEIPSTVVERAARARYEAQKPVNFGFNRQATWEEACQIDGWLEEELRTMRLALTAASSWLAAECAAEGWVCVPREPTPDWVYTFANNLLGEGPSVRCEGPSGPELESAQRWITRTLAAAPPAPSGDGWRGIAEAPEKPCGVLLYYPIEDCHPDTLYGQNYAIQVAFWNGGRFCEQGTAHDVLDERADAPEERPTLWQPLPPPPRGGGAG